MKFLNRSIVIIKPKQPFVDWINRSDNGSTDRTTLKEARACGSSGYLIPETERVEGLAELYQETFGKIFEHQLRSWGKDPAKLPKRYNTYKTFNKWFEWECYERVYDLIDTTSITYEEDV